MRRVLLSPAYLLLCCGFMLIALSPSHSYGASNNLLDKKPIKTVPASTLPKWQKILQNHYVQMGNTSSKNMTEWNEFINSLQGQPKLRQMMRVNVWFKKFNYKQDNWIYGEDDYWATPAEFLSKGGDCEDFAIIKYLTLKKLGFPASSMKIAMVYDVYSGTDHSFLVVKHNGAEFVLDNREKLVVARYMKNRYVPHYAFNETNVWTYDSPLVVEMYRKKKNAVATGNR